MTWETVQLREVTSPVQERAGTQALPVYSVTKHSGFVPSSEYFKKQVYSTDLSTYKVVDKGQFAYATIHLDEGSVGVAPSRCVISPMYTVFSIDEARVSRDYFLRFLKSPVAMAAYPRLGRGTAERRKSISLEALGRLEIPLPPLPEQRRIAAILDEAAGIRSTFARGDRLWHSITESLLRSAVLGAQGSTSLGSHLRDTQNGLYKPSSDYGSGTPIIRIDSFGGGTAGVTRPLKRVRVSESERAKFTVAPGQILVNRVNALSHLGKATLIQELDEPTIFESNMMRLDLAKSIEPRYVLAWLASADARDQIRSRAKKAINQASINQTDVAELRIPSIPVEKQRHFAWRLAEVERVRAASEPRATQLDALFASLEHRAFRGEL